MLPLAERRCGLVLTVPAEQADAVAAMDDAAYVALAQQPFRLEAGAA